MNLFGPTDKDLHLLRLDLADLTAACEANCDDVYDQIDHHCMRLAWKEHARTSAPVRQLLHVIAGNAHARLMAAVPNEEPEHDGDLLRALVRSAQRKSEVKVCLGFLLDKECRDICRAVVEDNFHRHRGIFDTVPHHLVECWSETSSQIHAAYAALLKLRDFWSEYRRGVAADPIARETVRIVATVTNQDPQLLDTFVLNVRLSLLNSWIAEHEAGTRYRADHSRRLPASSG